jgi:ribonuclease HI
MPLTATVHADASWSRETMKGGWAIWVKSERERVIRAGPCPPYVKDNNEAELAAIFAGLHVLSTRSWFSDVGLVYVRSDCTSALRWMDVAPSAARHPGGLLLYEKIKALRTAHPRCELDIGHVKGHQGRSTRPGYVNDRVDVLSREARHAAEKR